MMHLIRPPAVAGSFYPGRPERLADDVKSLLSAARPPIRDTAPKALIVPHAGYIYSGPIAASAYACLAAGRDTIRRVVLLGPVHRVPIRSMALPQADAFETPLGIVAVDRQAADSIRHLPQVETNDAAHAWEHSLEVQLPFLQAVLADFSLVPLAVGNATGSEVAEVLEILWGGPETLIVVSSDLSHYLPYEAARRTDRATSDAILRLDVPIDHEQACGGTPVNGLLLSAQRHHLQAELLDLRNSGDTSGDRSRVVGYGAFAFFEAEHEH